MPWIREGECPPERCKGRCCTHVGIFFPESEKDFARLMHIRGVQVGKAASTYLFDFKQRCQYLTADGLCGLHPSMDPLPSMPVRPVYCDNWPTEPSQLLADPYCGFTFRWVDEET